VVEVLRPVRKVATLQEKAEVMVEDMVGMVEGFVDILPLGKEADSDWGLMS
jgi:hypothetical protein